MGENYELELAKALNDRDAYGVVVSRLIEWFGDEPTTPPFEIADFEAVMMDAELMDEDGQLTSRAKKLFECNPLQSQIEEAPEEPMRSDQQGT